jgi:threonine synthase
MSNSQLSYLRCSRCHEVHVPSERQSVCRKCGRPLLAQYDLQKAGKVLSPVSLRHRISSLWRYHELLPVRDENNIISFGEGWTPIIEMRAVAVAREAKKILIKEEGMNPTGSFKARGLCMAVSKAKELGIKDVCIPSAGNAGGALAAYAARAQMKAHVFIPNDTPEVNIQEVSWYGAAVYTTNGNISDAAKMMNEMRQGTTWFDMSTLKEPYRLEGKKTIGYEIAEQMNWKLPDVIIYPAGGGTGLIGMWKAFQEMEELGWLRNSKPRMVAVQPAGCAPIVKAFNEKKPVSEFWNDAHTVASGLRVPKAFADDLILSVIYESRGTALSISDEEILRTMKLVASKEGLLLCPEGAATVAAAAILLHDGSLSPDETILTFNTATGYKYIELLRKI